MLFVRCCVTLREIDRPLTPILSPSLGAAQTFSALSHLNHVSSCCPVLDLHKIGYECSSWLDETAISGVWLSLTARRRDRPRQTSVYRPTGRCTVGQLPAIHLAVVGRWCTSAVPIVRFHLDLWRGPEYANMFGICTSDRTQERRCKLPVISGST